MNYDAIAFKIISVALAAGKITRADFNYVCRCGGMMKDNTAKLWHALNGAIWNHKVEVIEDGSTAFEVALSFDASGACNGVFSIGAIKHDNANHRTRHRAMCRLPSMVSAASRP